MKLKKLFVLPLLAGVLALGACGFTNPGDKLGGGKEGEVAQEADSTTTNETRDAVKSQSSNLTVKSSGDEATVVEESDTVTITQKGTYYFKGTYGKVVISGEGLKLYFIFDGASFTNSEGIAIDGSTNAKKTKLTITLNAGTENSVTNSGDDVNAIHIKKSLYINGSGTLNVTSNSKTAIKASGEIQIVDATLNLKAENHAIAGASVAAKDCTVNVTKAGKDGINAECDAPEDGFTLEDGFVSLTNVDYTCNVDGDGIQADSAVYIGGGSYDITTNGNFVPKTSMSTYGMTADDFKYIKSGSTYTRIASDETGRYSASNLYGLTQGCKGIKVGEISYTDKTTGKEVVVTDGDYLIAIEKGTFLINSTDDAIHTNSGDVLIEGGNYTLSTLDDAITSDVLTKITGGNINITTCYEGIEGGYVEISGGTINLTALDDGINAASDDKTVTPHIIISGGDITVDASGDGIDSNGSILISGGTVLVHGPTTGRDAGLDADKGIVITGGKVFVTSTLGMVETPSTNSTQYVVSYAYSSTIAAGSTVSLLDSSGNELFSIQVAKKCQSIIFSTPDLKKGSTYSLYGGSTKLTSFTVSSIITTIGSSGSSFPGGGGPGGGPGGRW